METLIFISSPLLLILFHPPSPYFIHLLLLSSTFSLFILLSGCASSGPRPRERRRRNAGAWSGRPSRKRRRRRRRRGCAWSGPRPRGPRRRAAACRCRCRRLRAPGSGPRSLGLVFCAEREGVGGVFRVRGGGLRRGGRTTAKLFGEKEGKIKPPSSAKEDIRPTRAVPAFRLRLFSIESITKRTRNRHGEQDKEEDEARAEHCGVIDNWGKRQLGNDFFG